jgi:DNA-directed RNA polymerase specialized sigma24 family protein
MDERAFAEYVAARTEGLLQYAYLLSGTPSVARDLVLRALAQTYADWRRAEREGVDAYVKARILHDQLSLRRRLARRQHSADGDDDAARAALATLSPRQRAILVLRHHEGLSDGEIADALRITPGAVRSRIPQPLDERVGEVFADPTRTVTAPSEPVRWVREHLRRQRRRRTALASIVVGLAIAATSVTYAVTARAPASEPTPAPSRPASDSGLLTWTPRLEVGPIQQFVEDAIRVWQAAPAGPEDEVYLVWAGVIGDGRVALLQGVQPDGSRAVAQVTDRGQPARILLDRVDALPPEPADVRGLAVSYDGNTGLPNLRPGPGAQLLSLVLEPELAERAIAVETERRRVEMRDDGISRAWLQLDSRAVGGRVTVGVALRGGDREDLSVPVAPPGLVVVRPADLPP